MTEFLTLFSQADTWISLLTLTAMEIVLGIDNIVFITILCGRLPESHEHKARRLGIGAALVTRLLLLGAIGWVMSLTEELFTVPLFDYPMTGQKLILLVGGIFLVGKATHEIYENIEVHEEDKHFNEGVAPDDAQTPTAESAGLNKLYVTILVQVMALDIVFSLDSVITAVGMVEHISVMAIAMVIAVIVMLVFAGPIGDFIQDNPSVRILALAFLILIGVMLVMEGTGQHVSKGYIYAAMGFSLFVEMLNLRRRRNVTSSGEAG